MWLAKLASYDRGALAGGWELDKTNAHVIVTLCFNNSMASFYDIWKTQVGSVHVGHVSQPGIPSGNWNGAFGWWIKSNARMKG